MKHAAGQLENNQNSANQFRVRYYSKAFVQFTTIVNGANAPLSPGVTMRNRPSDATS